MRPWVLPVIVIALLLPGVLMVYRTVSSEKARLRAIREFEEIQVIPGYSGGREQPNIATTVRTQTGFKLSHSGLPFRPHVSSLQKAVGQTCEVHRLPLFDQKPIVMYGLTIFGPHSKCPYPGVYRGGCVFPPETPPPPTVPTCEACASEHRTWVSNFLAGVRR